MFFREVGQPPTSMCTIVSPSKSNTIKLTLNRIGILQLFWRPHCDVTIDCGSVRVHNPQMALCYLRRKSTVFISIPPNPCLIQYPLYTIKYLLSETTENPIIFHRTVPYFLDTAGLIQHRQGRWRWVGTGDAGGGGERERPERVHPEGAGAMICDEETGVSERYPLVMTNIAIENGHRNSWFTHKKWGFSIAMLVFREVPQITMGFNTKMVIRDDWMIGGTIWCSGGFHLGIGGWVKLTMKKTPKNHATLSSYVVFVWVGFDS